MADQFTLKAVLSANPAAMLGAFKSINMASKTTRKYLLDIANSAGKLGGQIGLPFGILTTVAGGFGLGAVKNAMVGLAGMEDEVSKFTATTGIAGSEFKKFQYLAKLGNVPFEALTGSMGKLNKGIGEAAVGKNKALAGLFDQLGIKTRGANGELRSAAEMLPELADAFQRNENPVVRARMGVALFGKSWQEIAPMLVDGSEKINQRLARFRELGLEVKDVKAFETQMDAAGRFGDRLDDLSFVAKGFQNTIASGLLPIIEPLLNDLIKWTVANKELIAVEVKAFVRDLADGLRAIDWAAVGRGCKDFISSIKWLVDEIGGAKPALIGLVILMNMQTIAAFWGLAAAVSRGAVGLGAMALNALAPVAPLKVLQAEMAAANMAGVAMVGTMGKLAAAFGVVGAAWAGWEIGKVLNDYVINPTVQKITGDQNASLGTALYDLINGPPKQSLVTPYPNKVGGEIKVSFENAPQGTRVEPKTQGPLDINTDVGYRSFATGMAY